MLRPTTLWIACCLACSAWTTMNADEKVPCKLIENVVYGHKDGLALTFDVATPESGAKGRGVILVASGGWRSSKSNVASENAKQLEESHWTQGLLKGGYTLFITRHGSGPRYTVPEMIPDIRRAVRFVRLHAADYGIDPNEIGITSGSSGGHLSLMVGLTGDDGQKDSPDPVEQTSSRVQAIVAWFPPTDLINWGRPEGYKTLHKARPAFFAEMFGSSKDDDIEAKLKSISPIYSVSSEDPPLLLIHGNADFVVPLQQSKLLAAKYEEAGLPVKLIVHRGGGHTEWRGIMDDYPAVWAWFDEYLKAGDKQPAAQAAAPAASDAAPVAATGSAAK